MSSFIRLIEGPSGRGKVFHGDELVSDVDYELAVHQRFFRANAEEVPGLKESAGRLSNPSRDLSELFWSNAENLSLELSDGRRLNFVVQDPMSGRIVGSGDFY